MRRIGELLVAEGLLSESAVNRALGFQRLSGDRVKLGSILLNWDLLPEDALLATLAKSHRCPAVDWPTLSAADIEIVRLLSSAQASRLAAIPYALDRGTLRVALINPSNLATVDEISAITGKRIAPGVTVEPRLLQAHQKFYGRHIPGEIRTIVQKLERRTTQVRRTTEAGPTMDFGMPDASVAIPVTPAFPDSESLSPPEVPAIDVPEGPHTGMDSRSQPSTPPAPPSADLPLQPCATSPDDPNREREDSLAEWVGEALAAFQQERGFGRPSDAAPSSPIEISAPPTPPRPAPAEDAVSGMWRPSPLEDADEIASGMWTTGEEAGPQLWEARSREEIGEAVLQNALTNLPRVLLFGAGKTVIAGWRGRGPNLTPVHIASVRIPTARTSVFTTVRESGVPHFGPVDHDQWPPGLAALLGETPPDCAIFPIRILDGVAAFLYADRLGQPMQYQDFALIARAAASTANILARFLRPNTAPVV